MLQTIDEKRDTDMTRDMTEEEKERGRRGMVRLRKKKKQEEKKERRKRSPLRTTSASISTMGSSPTGSR